MKKFNNQKGFSLVELIVVITIMAVLVGVIAPQFLGYVERSKIAVDQSNVDMLNSVTNVYYVNNTEANPFENINKKTQKSPAELIEILLASGELTSTAETKSEDTAIGWDFIEEKWYLNGPWSIDRMDINNGWKISVYEAMAAGYSMPIYDTFWLYEYMTDGDNDGMVGDSYL
jgi:prepilin-type N-terminal cleavage/methylation domain-containing protein